MDDRSRYRINVVSEQTGIPEATLRAWERRYRVPMPQRTPSGYRLYSLKDVRQVQQIRALCEAGMSPAEAARRVAEGETQAARAEQLSSHSSPPQLAADTLRFVESLQVRSVHANGIACLAEVLELCAKAATIVASRHTARPMLLIESERLQLEATARQGELVEVVASTREASSQFVKVEVICRIERLGQGESEVLVRGLLTLIPLSLLTDEA